MRILTQKVCLFIFYPNLVFARPIIPTSDSSRLKLSTGTDVGKLYSLSGKPILMPSDKFILLEQINSAIKKKWSNPGFDIFAYPVTSESISISSKLNTKNYLQQEKDTALIKKLEKKIESLECQNDHLFYFINFLIENLPDLVIKIVRAEWETKNIIDSPTDDTGINKLAPKSGCNLNSEQAFPTRREKDILELLVSGFCAKEIANRLFISETTVVTHKKNLKEKFHAKNTAELVAKAHDFCRKLNS